MHLVYIDESMENNWVAISALIIDGETWAENLSDLQLMRSYFRSTYGIYARREFHARDWVSGHGNIANRVVPKGLRCYLFNRQLEIIASLEGALLINAYGPRKMLDRLWERLVTRINRCMREKQSRAILICDEGKQSIYVPLSRKLRKYNYIPSKYGAWEDGSESINIPIQRVLEDPFFVRSDRSFFVQAADFCAYALLRQEIPNENRNKYGIGQSFQLLEPIIVTAAFAKDPKKMGIVRAD